MPDFNKKIEEYRELQAQQQDTPTDGQGNPSENGNPEFPQQQQNQPPQQDPREKEFDLGGVSYANDEEGTAEAQDSITGEARFSGFTDLNEDKYIDPNSWSPAYVNESLLSHAGKNVMYGVGQMIGDYGDIAQVLGGAMGMDMYEGNILSRFLQEKGDEIQQANMTYVPEEILNPEFKFTTFADPRFWTTHGARFVPQLVEILGTVGVGSLVKKGVQSGAKYALKEALKEGAESGLKATTKAAYKGAKGVNEVAGTGKGIGKIMTDRGQLTKSFGNMIENVTGGVVTNLRTSLANAGEVYNTYKDLKDENGNAMFTKEELSSMASSTFLNNMSYVGMDILSWGMTYGKGFKNMKNLGMGKLKNSFGKDVQSKYIGGLFTNSVSPLFQKMGKLGLTMGKEGVEEMVQESWEEWSKIKAYQDVHGSLEGYQGKLPKGLNPDGLLDVSSFMDFFTSKENESTRAISFALGGMGAGAFNVRSLVDNSASEAHQMRNRAENLKRTFEKGTEGKIWQDYHIKSQMAELIFEDKGQAFVDFASNLHDEGIINDEELSNYGQLFDDMVAVKDNIQHLNIRGKKALMTNIMKQNFYEQSVEVETAKTQNNIRLLIENMPEGPARDKAIKNETDLLEAKIAPLSDMIARIEQNKTNLLSNKKADPVDFDVRQDQFGNDVFVGSDNEVIEEQGEQVSYEEKPPLTKVSDGFNSLKKRGKEIFNNILGSLFNDGNVNPQQQANQPRNIQQQAEGAIDGLADTLLTPEEESALVSKYGLESIEKTEDGYKANPIGTAEGNVSKDNYVKSQNAQKEIKSILRNRAQQPGASVSNNQEFDTQNDLIIEDDKQTELTPDIYDDFVDTGKIPTGILNTISDKISEGKQLEPEETSIYQQHGAYIENNLKAKQELSEETKKDIDKEADSELEADYVKDAVSRKAKKSLTDDDADFENSLKNKKYSISDASKNIRSKIEDIFSTKGRAKNIKSLKDVLEYNKDLVANKSKFFDKAIGNIKKYIFSSNSLINDIKMPEVDHFELSQMIAVNDRLETMFPDLKPRAYIIENLSKSIGRPAVGYTLAGAVYIDSNNWQQDKVFMHEMAHVYFDLTKQDPATTVLLNNALKNEKLVDKIMNLYEDEIEYKDSVTGDIYKRKHLFGDEWDSLTKEERDGHINEMILEGEITQVPLKDQTVIAEEVFVATLEGPLSQKYNKLFDPKADVRRQFFAKKWWNKLKNRALNENEVYNEQQFLSKLNFGDRDDYNNAKDYIIEKFAEVTEGNDVSAEGRAKAIERQQVKEQNRVLEIRDEIKKSVEDNLGKTKPVGLLDTELDIMDDSIENNDYESFFELNRLKYVNKASSLIRDFSKNYNQVLRRRYFNANKNKPTNWTKIPVFDKDLLQVKLLELAKNSYSSMDFIRKIEDSSVEELFEFNKFMDKVRNDKQMFLQSMFYVYKNQSNINSVQAYVDKDGNYNVTNSLSNKEISMSDNILDKSIKSVGSYFQNQKGLRASRFYLDRFNEYLQASNNIRSGNYTDKDLYDVLKFFSNNSINTKQMFLENRLNINGKNYTMDTAIRAFVLSDNGMKDNSIYKYTQKGKYIKPGVRTFIQSIVATNRKFTADFTIQNAEGNQEPIRVIDNFLTREIDKITSDAKRLGKNQFINKYAHISKNFKDGSRSNKILDMIYDNIQDGKDVSLSQFHGIKNDNTGNASVTKNSNSSEQSLNEFLSFMSTSAGKKTYLMETGRFSDSPRSFIMEVPKIKLSEVGSYSGNKFNFNPRSKAFVNTAYNIYKGLGNDVTIEQFQDIISNDIQSEIEFLENNKDSLSRIPNLKQYIDGNGKLNPNGKNLVSEYVINQSFNGIYFNEIFFPSFPLKDRDKRAKLGVSPGFAFGSHVQIEPLYFVDDYLYKKDAEGNITSQNEVTDAGIYILEDDAKRLEEAGGNIMPLGKGYKVLLTGLEHDNDNFKGKNLYDKGYATIINDDVVADNPKLKGLYELMKERRAKYIDRNGNIENNLLSGIPTHFLYASPLSSNKAKNLPSNLTKKENGIDIPTEEGNALTLENLNNLDFEKANEIYDKWYYDGDDYIGISGDNFVVQQVMDKETYKSNTPIQMIRALTTNASVNGTLENVENIQKLISEMQQENLDEYNKVLNEGTIEEVRELLTKAMSLEQMDPLQKFLIEDNLSLNTPALREIAKNTLSNLIKKHGNKLETPGTIAQQKPAMYEKKYGKTNGSKGLAFYSTKNDGSLVKGEAVVPSYMEGKVKSRQSFTIDNVNTRGLSLEQSLNTIEARVKKTAKQRGVGYGPIYSDAGTKIGYYVEGDTIIATRIPAHGPQSTGVFEVIDYDKTGGSQVQLPYEFAGYTTGGDFDGDQVFIQHKGRGPKWGKWNEVMNGIENHWLSKEMAQEVQLGIEFEQDAEQAIEQINEVYQGKNSASKQSLHFSPSGRRKSYNNTLISKGNIGTTANLHGLIGMLSSYGVEMQKPITINGTSKSAFADSNSESRTINSAKLFNIILDNAKHGYADALGLNEHTVSQAMILRNLGYSLGDIGVILNSPVVEEWVKIMSNKENVFSGPTSTSNIEAQIRKTLGLQKPKSVDFNINTKNISTPENMNSTLSLMSYLSTMTSEINKISKVMSGHKELEPNPFILQEQLTSFDEVLENKGNKALVINSGFRNNPLVMNYKNVANINLENQKRYDPVFRKDGSQVYNSVISGVTKNLSKDQKKKLHDDIEVFFTSRLLGVNNIPAEYKNDLIKRGSEKNIYDRVSAYADNLGSQIIKRDDNNVINSVTAAENNLLFTKALRASYKGNNQFISLNNNFFNENMSKPERERVIQEFNELPQDIQDDLMVYDLMVRGWKGPQSLFHLFNDDVKSDISRRAQFDINNKDNNNVNMAQKDILKKAIINKNTDFLTATKRTPLMQKGNEKILNPQLPQSVLNNISSGKETFFKYVGPKGMEKIIHFKGFTNDQIAQLKNEKKDIKSKILQLAPSQMVTYNTNQYKHKIGLVSIKDGENGVSPFDWRKKAQEAKEQDEDLGGREARSDYYRFSHTLKKDEYDKVMEYENNTSELVKDSEYDKYLRDKKDSDKVYRNINEKSVKTKSVDQLLKLYEDYGSKNKFAYSQVLRAITMELSNRMAQEQSKLTGRSADGKDIGALKSWLMSNNIPSNHPAVQGLVRNMEVEYKNYLKERNQYVSRINNVTDALYKEKFGFAINSKKPIDFLKAIYYGLFKNREGIYRELYGNLVDFQEVQTDNGTVTNMKYKPKKEADNLYNSGAISQAEYDFYNATTSIMNELRPYVLQDGKGRKDYIPHTAPDMMEKLARRGLLGLAVNSKTVDERIGDVTLNAINPLTNKMEEDVSFKQVKDWYNTISKVKGTDLDKSKEYLKLKRRASLLLKKGQNQNGTPIRFSNVEVGSALGDVFLDRFSKSRSVSATDFPSLDLNKAFVDYVNSSLFVHGNENFKGMKKMLPYVDGILAQSDRANNPNMAKYVDKVWKQYFLAGKKQNTLPNIPSLEAVGISTDKAVDYITKGSLIYWLGFKGLAIGGGAYAIGNVLVGKYNNIKNAGGKEWLKGEKRFWLGKDGKIDIKNPFKGVQEATKILKNAGFMDINVYDDVNVQSKTSFDKMFSNLALLPMIHSEKWIQGVHFLGMLTDQEWNDLASGDMPISSQRMAEIENEVKQSHGKGYQATDQRMIQMYSWGRSMMQFSRYLPTMFYDKFAKEDINIYGKKHLGSYTAMWRVIQKVVSGEIKPSQFAQYRRGLNSEEKKRLDSGLIGFGLMSALVAINTLAPNKTGEKLFWDSNALFDLDKLSRKTTPPSVSMIDNLLEI